MSKSAELLGGFTHLFTFFLISLNRELYKLAHRAVIVTCDLKDLVIVEFLGLYLIKIKYGDDNKCRKSRVKSAVVEDKSTVHA